MANPYTADNGYAGFNYGSEQEKLKRRQQAIALLQQQALGRPQGSFVSNGAGTFYAGENGGLTSIARLASAALSSKANKDLDSEISDLDKTSQDALAYRLDRFDELGRPRKPSVEPFNAARDSQAANILSGEAAEPAAETMPVPSNDAQPMSLPQITNDKVPAPLRQAAAAALVDPAARVGTEKGRATSGMTLADANANAAAKNSSVLGDIKANTDARNQRVAALLNPKLAPQPQTGGATGSWGPQAPAVPTPPMAQAPAQVPPMPLPPTNPAEQLPPVPMEAPPQAAAAAANPIVDANPGTVTQPEQVSRGDVLKELMGIANTGPMGQQIATSQLNQMFGGKNGEYKVELSRDPNTGELAAVRVNSRTGQMEVVNVGGGSGSEKVLETKEGSNGTLLERTSTRWREAQMDGKPVTTAAGQEALQKRADEKAKDLSQLGDLKTQLASMQDIVPLIKKVGTGRLNTPLNNFSAYFTDSTDLDKMNRAFNMQQLQGAVQWLKGQGSITDAERRLLATSQFDPKASTQANMDYANTVIGMLQKHIPLAEAKLNAKYGDSPETAAPSKPAGSLYSWQK